MMFDHSSALRHPDSFPRLILRGALYGALAFALLAAGYAAVAVPVFGGSLAYANRAGGRFHEALIGAAVLSVCSGPFAIVLGILPGMALGALSGLVVGLLVAPLRHTLTRPGAALIGLLVAIPIVIAGNLFMGPDMIQPALAGLSRYRLYLFWVGGPSMLILVGLPAVGWALFQQFNSPPGA